MYVYMHAHMVSICTPFLFSLLRTPSSIRPPPYTPYTLPHTPHTPPPNQSQVNKILTAVRSKQNPASVVFVAATLNKQVSKLLDRDFPTIARAATSSLHKGVAGAQHNFLPLTAEQNKLLTLTQVCF